MSLSAVEHSVTNIYIHKHWHKHTYILGSEACMDTRLFVCYIGPFCWNQHERKLIRISVLTYYRQREKL